MSGASARGLLRFGGVRRMALMSTSATSWVLHFLILITSGDGGGGGGVYHVKTILGRFRPFCSSSSWSWIATLISSIRFRFRESRLRTSISFRFGLLISSSWRVFYL